MRRDGLMVSALVSGSSGPGSSPGHGHCVVFLGKILSQVHKWVPVNLLLGILPCDGLASHPEESRNTAVC